MALKTRIYIALAFICAFFMVAPLLILYTSGYQYDWQKHQWFDPGWIIVSSKPVGARVILNGQDTGLQTPAIIKNLLAGTYDVKVVAEGFYPWQNRVPVVAGLASSAKSVQLFRNDSALVPVDLGLTNWAQVYESPSGRWLALVSDAGDLAFFNAETGLLTRPEISKNLVGEKVRNVFWDQEKTDTALILFKSGHNALYSNNELARLDMPHLEKLRYYARRNEIWGIKENRLVTVHLRDLYAEEYVADGIFDFKMLNKIFYALVNVKPDSVILQRLNSYNEFVTVASFPKSQYSFIDSTIADRLTILSANQQVYVVNPPNEDETSLPEIILPSSQGAWDLAGELLMAVSPKKYLPSEIRIWDKKTGLQVEVARYHDAVTSAFWHPSGQFVLAEIVSGGLGAAAPRKSEELRIIDLADYKKLKLEDIRQQSLITTSIDAKTFTPISRVLFSDDGSLAYLVRVLAGKVRLESLMLY